MTGLGQALSESGRSVPAKEWDAFGATVAAATLVDWVTIASLAAYVLAAVSAYAAYRLRDFRITPNPDRLIERWINEPPHMTKAVLTR